VGNVLVSLGALHGGQAVVKVRVGKLAAGFGALLNLAVCFASRRQSSLLLGWFGVRLGVLGFGRLGVRLVRLGLLGVRLDAGLGVGMLGVEAVHARLGFGNHVESFVCFCCFAAFQKTSLPKLVFLVKA
jgi:hypothetical protein